MSRVRPKRLQHVHGIGVNQIGNIADASDEDFLRLENLDVDMNPDPLVAEYTTAALSNDECNSYLPFLGRLDLRESAAKHVSRLSLPSTPVNVTVLSLLAVFLAS